jgi:curved DNA-binding protein
MSIKFKDYYQTLEVSKDASPDAIKKSFRDLARRFHPDKVQGSGKEQAETRFKEINEAYEVLGNPEKREKYNRLGADWDQPQGRSHHPRAWGDPAATGYGGRAGDGFEFHFDGTGFSDFFEQYFGMESDPFERASRGSAGRSARSARMARGSDVEAEIMVTLEEVLTGSTRQISLRKVDPTNAEEHLQTFQVKVPKGVREGQRIRLAGQGGTGMGGAESGDLFLKVRLARHPDFRVQGDRLVCDLDLAPWEVVLGTKVNLDTLDGRVSLKIQPGSQTGRKLRLSGRGLPKRDGTRGDLHVILNIQVPETVDEDERRHWEALADQSKFNPRS